MLLHGARNTKSNTGDRDSNPRSVFTTLGFGIGELLSPGSRNPDAISQMVVKYRHYNYTDQLARGT